MKTKTSADSGVYSFIFLFIFLGILLFPFFSISSGLPGLLENFPGKLRFINVYTESRLALGDQVFNRAIVGPDHWLSLTDSYALTGYQNTTPLSEAELFSIQYSLEDFRYQVESNGAVFLFVVPPDKQTIYPENVPNEIPRLDGPSRLDQLIAQLKSADGTFPVLDLRPVLFEAKKTYPVYYATDTHWTPIGAFFAYQAILGALQPKFPGLLPHVISDYEIMYQDPILLDMNKIIGSTSLAEAPISFDPYFKVQAKESYVELSAQNNATKLYFSHIDNSNAPTVLILGDSFFNGLRPFVFEHFSQAVYVRHFETPDIKYLDWFHQFQPDIVIFEITERHIGVISSVLNN